MQWYRESWLKPTKSEYNRNSVGQWWLQCYQGLFAVLLKWWSQSCQKQQFWGSSGPSLHPSSCGGVFPSPQIHRFIAQVQVGMLCTSPRAGSFTMQGCNAVSHWIFGSPWRSMSLHLPVLLVSLSPLWPKSRDDPSEWVLLCWCFPRESYHSWVRGEEEETLPSLAGLPLFTHLI